MKHFINSALAVVSGFVCIVSCSEQESDLLSLNQSSTHQLSIVTHTREGETPIASVYLFNGSNELVRTLQTDASSYTSASASTTVKLLQGNYTLSAINASALSSFQIPESPTPTTAITPASGLPMGDLLMATGTATLSDGESKTVDLSLERKVIELSSIAISQVPSDVTGVAVSISPLYSAIQFNGTYVDADPTTCTCTLASTSTAGIWQATPQQLAFPSKGVPTITVTFTYDDETTRSYAYTADAALLANNKYDIAGTYTEPLGVTLSGSITLQPWATNPSAINFDFDNNNAVSNTTTDPNTGSGSGNSQTTDAPVVGQQYNGCYVVSVSSNPNTAVLISPTERKDYTKGNGWNETLANALSSWEVEGVTVTGTWRIPTLAEIEAISAYPEASNMSNGYRDYFCLLDSNLKVVRLNRKSAAAGGNIVVNSNDLSTEYGPAVYLRPVIDITY